MDLGLAIERLTGVKVAIGGVHTAGRNVWFRPTFNGPGAVHVEVLPKDKPVNDRVMAEISREEVLLDGKARYQVYRSRCNDLAKDINRSAVYEGRLALFVSSNGHLTKMAKQLIETFLPVTPA